MTIAVGNTTRIVAKRKGLTVIMITAAHIVEGGVMDTLTARNGQKRGLDTTVIIMA